MKKHMREKEEARMLRMKTRMHDEEDEGLDELEKSDDEDQDTNRGQSLLP